MPHRTEPVSQAPPEATQPMNGPSPLALSDLKTRPVVVHAGVPDRLGPYRLLKQLGSGGMGVVYLAEDTQLSRRAAVKVMRPEALAADDRARDRFLREAQAAAAVKNDHVVTVYQVGEAEGVPFLAMELLRGLTLDAYLEKGSKPAIPSVARLGREMADGLAAAHDRGLIH